MMVSKYDIFKIKVALTFAIIMVVLGFPTLEDWINTTYFGVDYGVLIIQLTLAIGGVALLLTIPTKR